MRRVQVWLSRRRPLVLIASASFTAAAAVAACRAQPSCASASTHGRKFHALSYTPRRPLENLRLTPQPAAPAAASLAASPRRCPRSHSSFVSSWRSRYSPNYAIQRIFLHSTPSALLGGGAGGGAGRGGRRAGRGGGGGGGHAGG